MQSPQTNHERSRNMSTEKQKYSAPYASFSSFIGFFNKLKEIGVPSRIDPSVFGNASGSITYSVIASLKSLKLISHDGNPSDVFKSFVTADEADRKTAMKGILRVGYPTLWGGGINLTSVTSGQFDEHLKEAYSVSGATVDRAASFFIAAADYCGEPISSHLKARKAIASSPASKKSVKQRRKDEDEVTGDTNDGGEHVPQIEVAKPLEYQLIDLMKEPDIDDEIKSSIWRLVQYLTMRKASGGSGK
jgi:Family of unknown function (DUF5343)